MSDMLPRCPSCGARLIANPDGDGLWCQFCSVRRDDPDAVVLGARWTASNGDSDDYEPPTRVVELDLAQQRVLDSAWDSIQAGDRRTAAYLLHSALSQDTDFADAWYLLSKTVDNRGEKLLYLNRALEAQPYHEYAWHDKGVLEGVIPAGDSDLAPDPGGEAVEAESETQNCPMCGGALTFDAARGGLVCQHCGARPGGVSVSGYRGGADRLDNALLQRRFGFSREWHIGARLLICQNCHAQLTLGGLTLSVVCPFCNSAHVLIQDAVGSFEEPDALVPFRVDRQAAAKAVHARLDPVQRGQVERGELVGVYLPFWAFEGLASVIAPPAAAVQEAFRPGVYGANTVLVAGIDQPPQTVLAELMPYDLRALVRYDAGFLARWPAEIYSTDVIQASITARAYVKYAARQQATGWTMPDVVLARSGAHYNPSDTLLWRTARVSLEGLNYRLLLLPVWMIALYTRDGMARPAVVNGQTGEAVIAASFARPATIIAGPERGAVQDLPLEPEPARRRSVIRPISPPDRGDRA